MSNLSKQESATYYQPDPVITYHNPFSNTIFDVAPSRQTMSADAPEYQRFTATGRPIRSSQLDTRTALSGGAASADSWGQSAPNLLPVRFNDDSIISVPVLPNGEPTQLKPSADDSDSDESQNPVKTSEGSRSRFSISFRRKSSSGNTKKKQQEFIIKKMTRGNYLKHYAKDDNGKYTGTEEPAMDCILSNADDRVKWRRA